MDLDIFGGTPEIGNGAPSDSFSGAANQAGVWNRIGLSNPGPIQLLGLNGASTNVTYSFNSVTVSGGIGYNNPANTGDYALLLNDATAVAATGSGGSVSYLFTGFSAGTYDIFTYAAHPDGRLISVPISVPEATFSQTQVVTGPMAGNAFELLVTHSIHRVTVSSGGGFHINIVQPPGQPSGSAYCINGFQIAAVPEVDGWLIIMTGVVLIVSRKKITGCFDR